MKDIVVLKIGVGDMPKSKAEDYVAEVRKQFEKVYKKKQIVALGIGESYDVTIEILRTND